MGGMGQQIAGVSRAAWERLIAKLDALSGVHSLVVMRAGTVVAEAHWAPYLAEQPQMLFSATKTFTAFAIGCLIAEGKLQLHDAVIDLLPAAAPAKPSRKLQNMQVKHLLTMTTGHETEPKLKTGNWAKSILKHPVKLEPGSKFLYNSMASHLLSVIVTKLTGQKLIDYLIPRLFEPLGIAVGGEGGATWEQDPQGNNTGGWGLALRPMDLAKFGQLLLQRGTWEGRQLVPAEWVDAMMARQVDTTASRGVTDWTAGDWAHGYGYQMWRCSVDAARADGAFGQFSVVWPQHGAVITITAGADMNGGTQAILSAIWECLGSAFSELPAGASPSGASDQGKLDWAGTLPRPDGAASSPILDLVDSAPFQIEGTTGTVTVKRNGDLLEVAYSHPPAMTHVAAHGAWHRFSGVGPEGTRGPAASSYAWTTPNTLVLQTYGTATPFGWTHTLTFDDDDAASLTVRVDQNVSFGPGTILNATARRV